MYDSAPQNLLSCHKIQTIWLLTFYLRYRCGEENQTICTSQVICFNRVRLLVILYPSLSSFWLRNAPVLLYIPIAGLSEISLPTPKVRYIVTQSSSRYNRTDLSCSVSFRFATNCLWYKSPLIESRDAGYWQLDGHEFYPSRIQQGCCTG